MGSMQLYCRSRNVYSSNIVYGSGEVKLYLRNAGVKLYLRN